MKIGTENKTKVGALVALGLLAAYLVYSNLLSGPSSAPAPRAKTNDLTALAIPDSARAPDTARSGTNAPPPRPGTAARNREFHPVLRSKKKEEQIADISKVDPTLRLGLLAKVQAVPQAGAERDLFQILAAPPVKAELKGPEPKVYPRYGPDPPPPPPPPPLPPEALPPLPIPLKYYGFCTERNNGRKTAYFLDNDDILQATEGMTLKGRYRVVQIGLTSVVMEDTQSKRRQTLPLEQEVVAG